MSDERERQGADGGHSSNVKPKPNVKNPIKKEKSANIRRSRSTDSERGERSGRRREKKRDRESRRERGRSEESRGQHRKDAPDPHENDINDTECVVCFCSYDNVFKTPKLLSCGHTFCLECLARINVTSQELKFLSCPVCRELTDLPHGRDLPQLNNNKDIFSKLPPEMQRALSVRFMRNKGKLVLKKPPPGTSPKSSINLPTLKKQNTQPSSNPQLGTVEQGVATVVDVGRPPSRVRGRVHRMFRSDQCYYAVVASIIVVTVVLMLVGILAFVIMPNVNTAIKPNEGNPNMPH
ncbi:E3 ubiquitin-protein ligase RNF183 [Esox lucius]|uniref:RING-type domain-containing protein n=1 Tax=Esox lucius TaxID=8010 RepID=A0AAY5L5G6_ESOLU|nr:E3 ubiquitin-protein ligase RNF183 [Esox lucius]XP_034145035.1 E3 ubiquitin-protein ligase RNF183 [Esox lucius]